MRLDTEATLQLGGAGAQRRDRPRDASLAPEPKLLKDAALQGMDWLRRLHDGGIFVIVQGERRWHRRAAPDGNLHDEAMCEATSRGQARTCLCRRQVDPRRMSDSGRGVSRVKLNRRSERCAATATAVSTYPVFVFERREVEIESQDTVLARNVAPEYLRPPSPHPSPAIGVAEIIRGLTHDTQASRIKPDGKVIGWPGDGREPLNAADVDDEVVMGPWIRRAFTTAVRVTRGRVRDERRQRAYIGIRKDAQMSGDGIGAEHGNGPK